MPPISFFPLGGAWLSLGKKEADATFSPSPVSEDFGPPGWKDIDLPPDM